MTEKEKCLQGLLYNANYDEELLRERAVCKDRCLEYNQTKSSDIKRRKELLKQLVPNSKENISIEPPFWCDYGYNIEFGNTIFVNHNLVILDEAKVTLGDNIFIGPNCSFYTAVHPLDAAQRNEGLEYARPISIGNNVWLGGNVVVLPGVNIGDHSVIGAGSVVTKDIPANVVAFGNPCKVIRQIEQKNTPDISQ
ncbi:sugar O-acetyltransferase [Limibacterium fermenti]|uniref:sugar O-acetyltransferase n=1 Tax=Limibacterium fermenti TaxID=3229863 RepID=UPI000E84A017|nr:maltose acetyltransferase [Porphyromonadaceae bacterium]